MRIHFFSRLTLLLVAGFLTVASLVWTGGTVQWLFVAGGVLMILGALADSSRSDRQARLLDSLIGVLGVWTIIEAFLFENTNLEWWSFASAVALAALSTLGLIQHEMSTERVVHELSVVGGERHVPAAA